jgi:hypothetical protein
MRHRPTPRNARHTYLRACSPARLQRFTANGEQPIARMSPPVARAPGPGMLDDRPAET